MRVRFAEMNADDARAAVLANLAAFFGDDAARYMMAMEDRAEWLIEGEPRGGFAAALAVAWRHGDLRNRMRIELAFPELWNPALRPEADVFGEVHLR